MIRVASTKGRGLSMARKESDKKKADADKRMTSRRHQQRQNRRMIEERSCYSKCSLAMILPTTLLLTTGATITMCSTSPIIGGSLFYDSPKRSVYQITGGTLLGVGTVMMIVGYVLYKYVRTGEQRKLEEQKLIEAKQKAVMHAILANQNATMFARAKKNNQNVHGLFNYEYVQHSTSQQSNQGQKKR